MLLPNGIRGGAAPPKDGKGSSLVGRFCTKQFEMGTTGKLSLYVAVIESYDGRVLVQLLPRTPGCSVFFRVLPPLQYTAAFERAGCSLPRTDQAAVLGLPCCPQEGEVQRFVSC